MKFVWITLAAAALALAADDRITAPIDSNQRVPVRGQVHPAARAGIDQGALPPDAEISYATILLQPAPGLETFLAEQQNPSSPEFHKWLTPEQFADRFGLTAGDTVKIAGWLRSQGLQVHDVARGRHWISFSGSSATMSRALRTEFHRINANGKTHFSNTTDPQIPAAIAGVTAGFLGLNDFDPQPASVRSAAQPESNVGTSHFIVPDDLATIYNIAPLYKAGIDGTGVKIAIVGRADISLSDIRAFRKRFNLPPKDPQIVLVGPDPGANSLGDLDEANLDVQWSGAVAPNATIVYVNAKSVNTSLLYAIDQNVAPVLSESFGSCEPASQPGMRVIGQQANAQGITWIAASGDWGAATCDFTSPSEQASKGFSTSFPATLPEVTAIGGTTFNDAGGKYWASSNGPNLGSALSYIPETVMNDTAQIHVLLASGGGASVFFSKPFWQAGPGVPDDKARDVPDVSMNASAVHDGVEVVSAGTLIAVGGTSVGAPIFAGVTGLLNHYLMSKSTISAPGLGNINPTLYRLAQSTTDVFHDVTTGDNKIPCVQGSPSCVDGLLGVAAGPGYDLATGWGSIDANNLVTRWTTGTASTTTLTANPTMYNLGDKIQLTAAVSGSGSVAPAGTVTFISNDVAVGSGTLAGGQVSVSADSRLIAGGSGLITAEYSGDGVYNSSGASVSVALNLPSSGSLVVPSVTPNPVTQSATNWPYTLRLTEKAGVATKLTGFTINGVNNLSAFPNTTIPARGTVAANLAGNNVAVPLNRVYHFAGVDADGRTWSQDLTVPFVGPPGPAFVPKITLTSVPTTVQSNAAAGRACAYSQQLILEETTGFYHLLEQLTVGTTDISNRVLAIFGTDRLGPFATLHGTVCWPASTAPGPKNYQIVAVSEINTASVASVSTTLAPAAANPPSATASPRIVEMLADGASRTGGATVDVKFNGGSPQWTASVYPARAASWLTVSPLSGTGNAQLTVQASGAAISNGIYDATIVIQSTDTVPQANTVRVVFALGQRFDTVIDSVTNAASPNPVGAPGGMLKITGSNLAQRKLTGPLVEGILPLNLDGVSVTINGTVAPIYSIAPSELVVQIPYETSLGSAVLGVNNHGQTAPFVFEVDVTAPELFKTSNGFLSPTSSARPGQTISAFMTGDGDVFPFLPTGASPAPGTTPLNLPGPGLQVGVTVGGVRAPVTFVGVPVNLVGVTQINFTIPAALRPGLHPVVVNVGGVLSTAGTVSVAARAGN
ncbi:MAG: Ig-like domain repeat protein [Acidobacteriia bacterium]|nr:Ig-like domain repeat protein [Terriglobia bacterium]